MRSPDAISNRAEPIYLLGLRVDLDASMDVFEQALALARTDQALPQKWLERARAVSHTGYKTFTPLLGTALLAKATNKQIDALSLKERSGFKGYNARSVAERVLWPRCVEEGIDLRSTSANPLNSSTVLRRDQISRDLETRSDQERQDVNILCDVLEAVDFLDTWEERLQALAAFLRVRIQETDEPQAVDLGQHALSVWQLSQVADDFINSDTEGGRRGQALLAATLELVFPGVVGAGINDPDRHFPGDVGALTADEKLILAAEAKQKPVTAPTVLMFARRLADAAIGKGIYAALAPNQDRKALATVTTTAAERYAVTLHVFTSVGSLMTAAFLWSNKGLKECLSDWPDLFQQRLMTVGAQQTTIEEWRTRLKHGEAE